MKFKVNKIAAAVAVSLGTAVVGMNAAQADEVLFPYVVASDTVTTILTAVNDDDFSVPDLHYRYYYKKGADSASTSCVEANYSQPTSPNDVVTFDVSGQFGDAKAVLFEPASTKAVYDKSFAIFRTVKPIRAFAMIDNNDRFFAGQDVHGEAFIIQFTEGAVWGYGAYNAADIVAWDPATQAIAAGNPYDFSDRVENAGEVLVPVPANADPDNYWVPIGVMPFAEVTTSLFVTPIGTVAPFQLSGTIAATVGLQVNSPDNPAPDVMYDRDENPFSGQIPVPVVCVAKVDVPTMISEATRQFLADSGGWTNVAVRSGQAVVLKLEYNDKPPATLDGQDAGGGTYNNGFWLRKGIRESQARVLYPGVPTFPLLPVFQITKDQTLNSPFPLVDLGRLAAFNAANPAGALPWPPAQTNTALQYIQADVLSTNQ